MAKAICNEDCKINFTNPAMASFGGAYAGDIPYNRTGIVFTLATKVKALAKFILLDKLQMTWAVAGSPCPFTSGTHNFVSGAGNIIGTSLKVKGEGKAPLLLNDAGTCAGSWTLKVTPFTPVACACTLKMSDAGQTKVTAN